MRSKSGADRPLKQSCLEAENMVVQMNIRDVKHRERAERKP
ncbi:hypothetical protein [Mesorhizobium sp.]|nr:hypothetical protein [Mesorhizobium sp.]